MSSFGSGGAIRRGTLIPVEAGMSSLCRKLSSNSRMNSGFPNPLAFSTFEIWSTRPCHVAVPDVNVPVHDDQSSIRNGGWSCLHGSQDDRWANGVPIRHNGRFRCDQRVEKAHEQRPDQKHQGGHGFRSVASSALACKWDRTPVLISGPLQGVQERDKIAFFLCC